MPAARRVTFVLFDELQLLDLAGPTDVFRTATLLGAAPGYELVTTTRAGTPVRSVSGTTISPDTATGSLCGSSLDTLMVVGGSGVGAAARDPPRRPTGPPVRC